MKHEKLVRDKIPQIIEQNNEIAITRVLSDEEYENELERKLSEEVNEYFESKDITELADVIEVVKGLLAHKGFTYDELESIRKEKEDKRGSFSKKLYLIETRKSDNK